MYALEYKKETWRQDAACLKVGAPTGIFFSEDLSDISQAKLICSECPSMLLCLEAAVERKEPWGVWGGQLFQKGRLLTSKRSRGRPRKITNPKDDLVMLPVPVHLQTELRSA